MSQCCSALIDLIFRVDLWVEGFHSDTNYSHWAIWHAKVFQSVASPPCQHCSCWLSCKWTVVPCCSRECFLPTFKMNQPLTHSRCFHYSRWRGSISSWKQTVVKLLNKHATGLYSIPWPLQHTPVPPAISCWCSAFLPQWLCLPFSL